MNVLAVIYYNSVCDYSQMLSAPSISLKIPRTYVAVGETGLDYDHLHNILREAGYKNVSIANAFRRRDVVGIMWQDAVKHKYDHRCYHVKSIIKNVIQNTENITNKDKLYENMTSYYPDLQCFAKQWSSSEIRIIDPSKPLIVKPVGFGAFAGSGIRVVSNMQEFRDAIASIHKNQRVVICEYITNPLLLSSLEYKKFHLRMYLGIAAGANFKWSLASFGKIITAAKPYENSNFDNPAIHDTHMKSTVRNLYYPDDLSVDWNNVHLLDKQMIEIAKCAAELMRYTAASYPESKYGFQIYGMDFLITDEYKVILLEINHHCGFLDVTGNPKDKLYSEFSQKLFQWACDEFVFYLEKNAV